MLRTMPDHRKAKSKKHCLGRRGVGVQSSVWASSWPCSRYGRPGYRSAKEPQLADSPPFADSTGAKPPARLANQKRRFFRPSRGGRRKARTRPTTESTAMKAMKIAQEVVISPPWLFVEHAWSRPKDPAQDGGHLGRNRGRAALHGRDLRGPGSRGRGQDLPGKPIPTPQRPQGNGWRSCIGGRAVLPGREFIRQNRFQAVRD